MNNLKKIDPERLAFDVDGVLADTMTLFLAIARDEFKIDGLRYEDITSYNLQECLDIEYDVIEAIVEVLISGRHHVPLKPIPGADIIMSGLARQSAPLLFVTARPENTLIEKWIREEFKLDASRLEVVATGSFDGKADILAEKKRDIFVEDRLETCFSLYESGVTPILFKQPWNRAPHPFTEVTTWEELGGLIDWKK